jgi:hypothetical protein
MKVTPLAAELFHADGQTNTTKLIVAFRNSANAPKNYIIKLFEVQRTSIEPCMFIVRYDGKVKCVTIYA